MGLRRVAAPKPVAYARPLSAEDPVFLASVLVVDDDVAALSATSAVLSAAGYAVSRASCGRQALREITVNRPDVLVTDILMPECDGIELITAVKGSCPDMPVIAVTGRRFLGGLDLLHLASRLGASAVLDKPLGEEKLLATVARLVVKPAD